MLLSLKSLIETDSNVFKIRQFHDNQKRRNNRLHKTCRELYAQIYAWVHKRDCWQQQCHIPTLPFFGVMQSYILQARTGDRSLSRRHERPLLWTVYQWSQCSAQMLWHHSIRLLIQDSDVLNVLGVKELKELSHLYYYLTCKFSKKSSHCKSFFYENTFWSKKGSSDISSDTAVM